MRVEEPAELYFANRIRGAPREESFSFHLFWSSDINKSEISQSQEILLKAGRGEVERSQVEFLEIICTMMVLRFCVRVDRWWRSTTKERRRAKGMFIVPPPHVLFSKCSSAWWDYHTLPECPLTKRKFENNFVECTESLSGSHLTRGPAPVKTSCWWIW